MAADVLLQDFTCGVLLVREEGAHLGLVELLLDVSELEEVNILDLLLLHDQLMDTLVLLREVILQPLVPESSPARLRSIVHRRIHHEQPLLRVLIYSVLISEAGGSWAES